MLCVTCFFVFSLFNWTGFSWYIERFWGTVFVLFIEWFLAEKVTFQNFKNEAIFQIKHWSLVVCLAFWVASRRLNACIQHNLAMNAELCTTTYSAMRFVSTESRSKRWSEQLWFQEDGENWSNLWIILFATVHNFPGNCCGWVGFQVNKLPLQTEVIFELLVSLNSYIKKHENDAFCWNQASSTGIECVLFHIQWCFFYRRILITWEFCTYDAWTSKTSVQVRWMSLQLSNLKSIYVNLHALHWKNC